MITDDPLLAELEAANPVLRTAKPGAHDQIEADRILQRVLTAPPRRRRRRTLTILAPIASALVVVAVVAVAFTAGRPSTSGHGAKRGLEFVLQAEPIPPSTVVTPAALSRSVAIIQQRLDALTPGFTVKAAGADRVVVAGRRVGAAEQARITALASQTARLNFYDWEADVLTPNGKPVATQLAAHDPAAMAISQGAATSAPGNAGAGGLPLYNAASLAAAQPRSAGSHNSRQGPEYFLFGAPGSAACAAVAHAHGTLPTAGQHCLLAGPVSAAYRTSQRLVIRDLAGQLPPDISPSDGQLLMVPQGTVVLQAQNPSAFTSPSARFFVLRDRVALTGAVITKPQVTTDTAGSPDVEFGFTHAGARRFHEATAQIAHRGQTVSTVGMTLDQHFAIALDGRLLTVPSIDFRTYPDGIIGAGGADITGGFTTRAARNLAVELRYGALPLNLRVLLRMLN